MDEERIINFKRRFRENARFSSSFSGNKNISNNKNKSTNNNTRKAQKQCKYCYRLGHHDHECFDKKNKRPPSMPDWVPQATCTKCQKKGHLAFNCLPKYNNKTRRTRQKNNTSRSRNNDTQNDQKSNFAGNTSHSVKSTYGTGDRMYKYDHSHSTKTVLVAIERTREAIRKMYGALRTDCKHVPIGIGNKMFPGQQ